MSDELATPELHNHSLLSHYYAILVVVLLCLQLGGVWGD